MFFKNKEKELSRRLTVSELNSLYSISENKLRIACDSGNLKAIKKAMKVHHLYEYALLHKRYARAKCKKC